VSPALSLALVWPSGWAWHSGAPYQSDYFMISPIWFTVWSSVVHAAIMAVQSFGGGQQMGHQMGHLLGDVPVLPLVAAVLSVLVLSSGLKQSAPAPIPAV
jgi:hypothetical protein